MVAVLMLILGAMAVVVAPLLLARVNRGQAIPTKDNRWIVPYYVVYGLGVAAFLGGAIFSSIAPIWGAGLIVPTVVVVRRHNAGLT